MDMDRNNPTKFDKSTVQRLHSSWKRILEISPTPEQIRNGVIGSWKAMALIVLHRGAAVKGLGQRNGHRREHVQGGCPCTHCSARDSKGKDNRGGSRNHNVTHDFQQIHASIRSYARQLGWLEQHFIEDGVIIMEWDMKLSVWRKYPLIENDWISHRKSYDTLTRVDTGIAHTLSAFKISDWEIVKSSGIAFSVLKGANGTLKMRDQYNNWINSQHSYQNWKFENFTDVAKSRVNLDVISTNISGADKRRFVISGSFVTSVVLKCLKDDGLVGDVSFHYNDIDVYVCKSGSESENFKVLSGLQKYVMTTNNESENIELNIVPVAGDFCEIDIANSADMSCVSAAVMCIKSEAGWIMKWHFNPPFIQFAQDLHIRILDLTTPGKAWIRANANLKVFASHKEKFDRLKEGDFGTFHQWELATLKRFDSKRKNDKGEKIMIDVYELRKQSKPLEEL